MDVNERRRAFYQFDLDKVELVLCLVIEDLLGGRVCTGPVSQGELVGLTGLHRAQVCRGLASLLGRKQVLFEEAPPAPAGCYGFCSLRWNEHRRSDRVPGAQGVRLGLDDGTDLNVALARRSAGAGVVNSSTGVDESSTLSVDRVEDGNASLPMNRRVGVDESSTLRAIAIRAVQNQSDIAVRTALRVDDLRGLRERLLSLSGCGWSGDERKELLDLARMGAIISRSGRTGSRGTRIRLWRLYIWLSVSGWRGGVIGQCWVTRVGLWMIEGGIYEREGGDDFGVSGLQPQCFR
jgi:hypothetical protein